MSNSSHDLSSEAPSRTARSRLADKYKEVGMMKGTKRQLIPEPSFREPKKAMKSVGSMTETLQESASKTVEETVSKTTLDSNKSDIFESFTKAIRDHAITVICREKPDSFDSYTDCFWENWTIE
jgi:hypothetical protein